jgi:hypothetical protein
MNPTSISTMPSAHGTYKAVAPVRPAAPVEPPGGNIESRPPPEPVQPSVPPQASGTTDTRGRILDVYA